MYVILDYLRFSDYYWHIFIMLTIFPNVLDAKEGVDDAAALRNQLMERLLTSSKVFNWISVSFWYASLKMCNKLLICNIFN